CWPERYNAMAHQELDEAFCPQVNNGHVLDQTVWNTDFEPGTDRLSVGGREHLNYLSRRRPAPDPTIYLQTAQDVPGGYDPEHLERYVEYRNHLDGQRIQAVQKYLMAYNAGRNVNFNVVVHDPPEVGLSGVPANISIQKMNLGAQGILPAAPSLGGGAGGGGGAAGG
ncbi:MAG: hypothetical protein JO112_16780, partial [Planctomycetes bacterium]|nr:hypothetical protein [Planctomycetota bacterium]